MNRKKKGLYSIMFTVKRLSAVFCTLVVLLFLFGCSLPDDPDLDNGQAETMHDGEQETDPAFAVEDYQKLQIGNNRGCELKVKP